MVSSTADSHCTELFVWLQRVLNFFNDGPGWGGAWFDSPAAASDPDNNVTVNLERCPV